MRTRLVIVSILLIGATLALAMKSEPPEERVYTSEFNFGSTAIFLPSGDNPYFPLQPGHQLRLEGEKDGDFIAVEITVLHRIRPVPFRDKSNGRGKMALARVVEEREWVNGELAEVSNNYYAISPKTGNVYNFGEDVNLYENGRIVSHEGSWLAGKSNASPGLIMPASFLHGARYSLGLAPGISEDRAEHMEMGLKSVTPAGTFENCVKTLETSPLEPDEESIIIYAPNVGIVSDESLILVEYNDQRSQTLTVNESR